MWTLVHRRILGHRFRKSLRDAEKNYIDTSEQVHGSSFQSRRSLQSKLGNLDPVVRRPISLNSGLNFNLGFFVFCSKAFSQINFSTLLRASKSSNCRQINVNAKQILLPMVLCRKGSVHVRQLRPEPSVTIPCLETNPSCQDMALHRQPKLSTRVSSSYMWFHIA